jgi:hypothetical protein
VRTVSGDIHGELQVSFALGDKLVPSASTKKKKKKMMKQKKNRDKPAGHEYPIMRAPKAKPPAVTAKGASVSNGQAPAAAKSVNASNGQVPVRLPASSAPASSYPPTSAAPYNYHNYHNYYNNNSAAANEPVAKAWGNLPPYRPAESSAPYRPAEYSAAYHPVAASPSPPITHTMMKPHQTYVGSPDHTKIPSDSPAPSSSSSSSSFRSYSPHTIFASPLGKVLLTDLSKTMI